MRFARKKKWLIGCSFDTHTQKIKTQMRSAHIFLKKEHSGPVPGEYWDVKTIQRNGKTLTQLDVLADDGRRLYLSVGEQVEMTAQQALQAFVGFQSPTKFQYYTKSTGNWAVTKFEIKSHFLVGTGTKATIFFDLDANRVFAVDVDPLKTKVTIVPNDGSTEMEIEWNKPVAEKMPHHINITTLTAEQDMLRTTAKLNALLAGFPVIRPN